MANSKISLLTSDTHNDDLTKGLKVLWNEKLLCDYTLVAEGESVPVHRVVMAACSPYFRAMFCGDMQESKESRVELKGITARTLRLLVNFAYTGELELGMENIEEIVAAIFYFQISEAEILCMDFVVSELDKENCVDILNLAEKYSLQRLQEDTNGFIKQQFLNLPEEVFVRLSWKHLTGLIGTDSLCVNSEYQLFEKVMLWIRENSDATEETVYDILSQVRFPLMSGEELLRASQTEVMTSSPKCQSLISEAQEYHKDALKQPLMQSERTQVRSDTRSYILSTNDTLYFVNQEQRVLDNNCRLKTILLDDYISSDYLSLEHMVVVDNYLYACHSLCLDYRRTCFHRYDPRFDEWLKLPTLTMQRDYLILVPYKQSIFAIGMKEQEEPEDACEGFVKIFSIEENKWVAGVSVELIGYNYAGVAFEQKLYVSGGQLYEISSCEVNCYTPSTNTWESKAPMNHERSYHEMAELNGVIYVFGGNEESSVEHYLPHSDQWTDCTKSRIPDGVFGVVVDKGIHFFAHNRIGDDDGDESLDTDMIYFEKFVPQAEPKRIAVYRHLRAIVICYYSCAGSALTLWSQKKR